MRERRALLDSGARLRADERIFSAVGEVVDDLRLRSPIVAAYWPMAGEPDPRAALAAWHRAGWLLALPVVLARAAPLHFWAWQPGEPLVDGLLGTSQPRTCIERSPDVIVLPCLGFDARAFRLGYGGGFYDRTLAEIDSHEKKIPHPVLAIGVAYDETEIQGFEPHVHDRPLDWIITQARRIRAVR